jgi:hypothetical protein
VGYLADGEGDVIGWDGCWWLVVLKAERRGCLCNDGGDELALLDGAQGYHVGVLGSSFDLGLALGLLDFM